MNDKVEVKVVSSFEFDETLARRNEQLIRSMYCAFVKYEDCIPSVFDMTQFIRKYNLDQIAKHLNTDAECDAVADEYERLEDKNLFVMMEDYVRTVVTKVGWCIYDSPEQVIANGVIPETGRLPNIVVYGDNQNIVFPQFVKYGVCAQGDVLNVARDGIPYLGLGDGS